MGMPFSQSPFERQRCRPTTALALGSVGLFSKVVVAARTASWALAISSVEAARSVTCLRTRFVFGLLRFFNRQFAKLVDNGRECCWLRRRPSARRISPRSIYACSGCFAKVARLGQYADLHLDDI